MRRSSQLGLTLIEMMISMAVGLVVVGAVSYVYLGSKGTYRGNESLAHIQEAGRFALDSIARDVRSAGALGCGSVASIQPNATVVPKVYVSSSAFAPPTSGIAPNALMVDGNGNAIPILGFVPSSGYLPQPATQPAGWSLPTATPTNAPPLYWGGDVLQLQVPSGKSVRMNAGPDTTNGDITIIDNTLASGGQNFNTHDYALLADCATAAVFQITSVSSASSSSTPNAALLYYGAISPFPSISLNTFPTVQHFDQVTYYVGQIPGSTPVRSALYRYSMAKNTVDEIVANVEDMDVMYGVDTGGTHTAGVYEHADAVTAAGAWGSVVSVRVSLIAAGDEQGVAPQGEIFALHGSGAAATPAATDGRLRQMFSATAALRDRLQ